MVNFTPPATIDYTVLERRESWWRLRRGGLRDIYGLEPYYLLLNMLGRGAKIINETYFDSPPAPSNIYTRGSPSYDVTEDEFGYHIAMASGSGGYDNVLIEVADISAYKEVLIMCQLMSPYWSAGIMLCPSGDPLLNHYHLEIVPALSGCDFKFWVVVNGSGTVLASESVDLAFSQPHPVAWYYVRSDGRHVIWRNGVKKFDLVNTQLTPDIVCFAAITNQTTVKTYEILNPIIIVGL